MNNLILATITRRGFLAAAAAIAIASAGTVASAANIVTFDQGNQLLTRWAADGVTKIWENPNITHDAQHLEVGPDGKLYLGGWTDDHVYQINPNTGAVIGFVANTGGTIDRTSDITFGNDVDNDGIEDLYTATGTSDTVMVWTSSSGYTSGSDFVTAALGGITQRAWALSFGPDQTGDGIRDLYVVDGASNNDTNDIRVYNGVSGAFHTAWDLTNIRIPYDVIDGSDGRIYVASAGRNNVHSFDPDGTNEFWNGAGINKDGLRYPRQVHEGVDGKYYVANRLAGSESEVPYGLGSANGGVTAYSSSMVSFDSLFVEVAGADFSGVTTIPEPASLVLLACGGLAILGGRRRA